MKLLVLLLAAANLTLFAYILLDRWTGGEPGRLGQQINRDRVKLLTPQQVAVLGPSKAAALPNVCLEWGPFPDSERERAAAALEPFQLGRLLVQRRVEASASWWAFVPAQPTRAAAERRAAELRTAGFADLFIVEAGEQRYAVSLGVFRSEEAARRMAERARERGFAAVQHASRGQVASDTVFVVRDPQPALLARVRELQPEFGGLEPKTGPCPESN